ncbi:hypothetical protein B0F90DRAFT_1753315 [Multifurca ochricompacta]|uniref:Uncharacterized protein n=1 Tax=Multifurca ochricompacta TaxID=376703 RepID=A0AAD4M0E9_9AGAM|nr:hypothetical protein B0F90DRAFT_1753315 [Multifurca ochricompacta]
MVCCMANNYSHLRFWRAWHRYLYTPLSGMISPRGFWRGVGSRRYSSCQRWW